MKSHTPIFAPLPALALASVDVRHERSARALQKVSAQLLRWNADGRQAAVVGGEGFVEHRRIVR